MWLKATVAIAFAFGASQLGGCDGSSINAAMGRAAADPVAFGARRASSREIAGEVLEAADTERRLLDHAWIDAAALALASPIVVDLPYAEWGGFQRTEPAARGFAFTGAEGQVVKISLARAEDASTPVFVNGNLRVELFMVQRAQPAPIQVRLAEIPSGSPALWFRLPASASYVVRLEPEPLSDVLYRFSLELEAALPFPVKGRSGDPVGSEFGAPRDLGARHHEGVDIFAPRLTPVVAVADGDAMPRENRLGGNTIWLSTPGTSYYYAHLDSAVVTPGQRVRAGQVIGYVGNTGNAITTEPHLHFGVYRWGQGAVDPLPLLQARRFAPPSDPKARGPRPVQASAGGCAGSRRAMVLVASYGCALHIGAESRPEPRDVPECASRELPPPDAPADRELASAPSGWDTAAPLALEPEGLGVRVPVDLDAVGPFELAHPSIDWPERACAGQASVSTAARGVAAPLTSAPLTSHWALGTITALNLTARARTATF